MKTSYYACAIIAISVWCTNCSAQKAAVRHVTPQNNVALTGPTDSMITITRAEYVKLKALSDSTKITISRTHYDSLLYKVNQLEQLCQVLYKKIGPISTREVQDPRLIPQEQKDRAKNN